MAVIISQIASDTIRVDDIVIYKDSYGKWVANYPLSPSQKKEFTNHLKAIGETLIE